MDISKIQAGQVYRGYKPLCETLGVKTQSTHKKKWQTYKWKRYFKYKRDGNKFIIEHVYNPPLPKNHNKLTYASFIPRLIAKITFEKGEYEDHSFIISKDQILSEFIHINDTYVKEKYKHITKQEEYKHIPFEDIEEIYSIPYELLNQSIEEGLHDLRSCSMGYVTPIFFTNNYEIVLNRKYLPKFWDRIDFSPYNETMFTHSFNPNNVIQGIYAITNTITGCSYIGSSINIHKRFMQHIDELKAGTHHNYKLQNAFDIYGYENFKFEILEIVNDTTQLPFKEYHYISLYHPKIYNISNPLTEYDLINKRKSLK